MRRITRKLRHWKQHWNKGADFVWSRYITYAGVKYAPGDDLPEDIMSKPTKLRRFWESRRIELKDFEAPNVTTGQPEVPKAPDGVAVESLGGAWFMVTTQLGDEIKVNGKAKLEALLEELRQEAEPEADEEEETDEGETPTAKDDDDSWLEGGKGTEEASDETVPKQAEVQQG